MANPSTQRKPLLRVILFAFPFLAALGALLLTSCTAAGPAGPTGPAGPQGSAGPQGAPGKDAPIFPGTVRQVAATIAVSKPANGTHFVSGEAPVVTATLKDDQGIAFTKDDFATLNLYMYGPQEPPKTKTAVKMLNAETDRTKTPHHYIDLLKNADANVAGNVITYKLKPVTDEEAGTYIASVYAVSKASGLYQAFPVVELQIGTATVEKQLVDGTKCQVCHKGADSGKFYLHHVDPGRSPTGSWAIDSNPVRTCKSCHNTDGYAAYSGNIQDPAAEGQRTPDPIVRRVHGVHMGEHLKNTFNVERDFVDYTAVLFPANVKNCNFCHLDDRNKTLPSRMACGACHDSVWFGDKAAMPSNFTKLHPGGPQTNDSACSACHQPNTSGAAPSITEAHKVEQPINAIDITLTPPANGKFYVAGEKPKATIVIRNDTGAPIDHTKVTSSVFTSANFYAYGPRYLAQPVLTELAAVGITKSRASVTNTINAAGSPAGWTFTSGDTFKVALNGNPPQVFSAPAGPQTPAQVAAWLQANLQGATATATATTVTINSSVLGPNSRIEIYNSPVTTKMGWKRAGADILRGKEVIGKTLGVTAEPYVLVANISTFGNDLRTDPRAIKTAANISYQLDDIAGLKPGTYMAYAYVNTVPRADVPNLVIPQPAKDINFTRTHAIGFTTFQVGTATPDKKVATNCTNCHSNTIWHLDEGPLHAAPFDTDYCLACHDYGRTGTGDLFDRVGGNSTSGWAGYGAKPIVARVHGVHFGRYLEHPEWIYAGNPSQFAELIFPQDIRNCTKCHSADTTGTWKTEPSRLACTSCHDSDAAIAHTDLMTKNPNPSDPYDPNRVETCDACHGAGREFSPDKVHNVANPYKPPYPREPAD